MSPELWSVQPVILVITPAMRFMRRDHQAHSRVPS